MTDPAPLRELRELVAAFVERPIAGALVVGCQDTDVLLLAHTLGLLDTESRADRFLLHFDPFTSSETYIDPLVDHVTAVTAHPPPASTDPLTRLRSLIDDLLADLPQGDHRLVVALVPPRIGDPIGFAALAAALMAGPFPPALRLVLRDDLANPNPFLTAESSPSDQVIAHRFHVSTAALLNDTATIARDSNQPPDARAQAFLQLAVHAHAQGHHAEAVAICEVAIALTDTPMILALAFTFRADALRAQGMGEPAHASARIALNEAVACGATSIIHHAATTLAELSQEFGDPATASTCHELAKRTHPLQTTVERSACEHHDDTDGLC